MLNYAIRRLVLAIPTLLLISLVIFLVVDLAPGSPMSQVPLTVPPEVRAKIRESLGLDAPIYIRYLKWLGQFFITEPAYAIDHYFGTNWADGRQRILSYQSRSPVVDIIAQRMPQTLLVVGLSYVLAVLVAIPIGIISAYRQYSWIDQLGTFISMIGFSVPTFFTGTVLIWIFAISLGWLPSVYDTAMVVNSWDSFWLRVSQMLMPVTVLTLFNASQISRYMRASMIDNLGQDYVRTARAKGLPERTVVMTHVFRNSLIPVVTVVALGVPQIFAGAIITERVFGVNGLGQQLITSIFANDIPMVQTLTFVFAALILLFNLIADLIYGWLDPRIRYD
ncbi:MAG: ABC transporter permease [Deltaproteobacteria bacterium]